MVMPLTDSQTQKDIVLQDLTVISSTFQPLLKIMAKLCSVVPLPQLLQISSISYYTFCSEYPGVRVSISLTQGAFVLDVQTITHSMPLVHHEIASISGSQVYLGFHLCPTLLEIEA